MKKKKKTKPQNQPHDYQVFKDMKPSIPIWQIHSQSLAKCLPAYKNS